MNDLHIMLDKANSFMGLYTILIYLVAVICTKLHIQTSVLLIFVLGIMAYPAFANENHVTLGLYTEHYENDSDELNEDNRLTQYTHVTDDGYLMTGSTFINSHGVRTYAAGIGIAHDNMGFAIIAVHGYKGYLAQHYEDIMFAPTSYYLHNIQGSHSIKINLVPTVYNVGYNYKF